MNYPKIQVQSDTLSFFARLIGIWIVYAVLSFMAPAAESVSRYGLSLTQANLLRVTILLPYLFIWCTALFSVVRFRRYTQYIAGSREEDAFNKITMGLWMLLAVIVIPSFITIAASYYPDSAMIQQFTLILRNYATLVLYAAGFWYLWQASQSLMKTVDVKNIVSLYRPVMLAGLAILTFIYIWLVFQNSFRSVSSDPLVRATYGLPDWLIILTIIVPYIAIWYLGSTTILNIWSYAKKVSGVIYRETFTFLAHGLTITILLLIGLQFLSQANAVLSHSALKVILVVIYIILLAIALGYLLIARGAQKLTKIEEVE